MVRRVYIAPGALRVSRPGFDAATADITQLSYSAALAGLGGAVTGVMDIPASPLGGPGNTPQLVERSVPLPPWAHTPTVWLWDARPDLADTGYGYGSLLVYLDGASLVFENRTTLPSYVGYLILRNSFL